VLLLALWHLPHLDIFLGLLLEETELLRGRILSGELRLRDADPSPSAAVHTTPLCRLMQTSRARGIDYSSGAFTRAHNWGRSRGDAFPVMLHVTSPLDSQQMPCCDEVDSGLAISEISVKAKTKP
jgi:hypothetical protein